MSASLVLRHQGFALEVGDDAQPRVRDLDLADRLGYERPRDIRELIKRWVAEAPEMGAVQTRRTVRRVARKGRGEVEIEAAEYWLTERQALFITTKTDTAQATSITLALIDAFMAARDELNTRNQREQTIFSRLINAILLPAPASDWERMFPASLVKALAALDGVVWAGGAHPRHLASTNRKIYDLVFSAPLAAELKVRNPEPRHGSNHHQVLTPEARNYFASQLDVVEALARASQTKADFWRSMEVQYAGGFTQLGMGGVK